MFIIISAGYCCCADSLSLYLLLIRMHARLFIRLSISLTQTVPLDLFILFIAIDIYSRILVVVALFFFLLFFLAQSNAIGGGRIIRIKETNKK